MRGIENARIPFGGQLCRHLVAMSGVHAAQALFTKALIPSASEAVAAFPPFDNVPQPSASGSQPRPAHIYRAPRDARRSLEQLDSSLIDYVVHEPDRSAEWPPWEEGMYYGERFNALSHLIAAVLALFGAAVLVVLAALRGDVWKVASFAIYGTALVLAYSVSTAYHSLRGRAKRIFRKLDHQVIYLLIAGSYTPFCLITLRGVWGWSLLGFVWALAVLGMLQEFRRNKDARVLSVVLYVVMGWVALVAVAPLLEALGPMGFGWAAAGGVFYTVGIVFYAFDEKFPYWHGIWHLFVVAGSATHYFVILLYVL